MRLRYDITDPYSPLEAWSYETLVAGAVLSLRPVVEAAILPTLPIKARLLDVGAGGGKLAVALAERLPAAQITGIDRAPAQVARAERAARHLRSRVRFVVGSAGELPFAGASFDGVFSVGSLKHWDDRARGLAECIRVLAPGGALCVLELDRGASAADTRAFVAEWRVPALLRPLFHRSFRACVGARSLELADARTLASALPLIERRVERVPGTPYLLIAGRVSGGGAVGS